MFSTTSPELIFIADKLGMSVFATITFFIIVVAWSMAWKGWALWTAAKRNEKKWFIALLLINTAGLLEIVYLFVLGKNKK